MNKEILIAGLFAFAGCLSAEAQQTGDSKFMRFTLGEDPMMQITFSRPEQCRAYDEASKKEVAAGASTNGMKFACSPTDVSSLLPFQGALREEYFGEPVALTAKTELMCLNAYQGLLKTKNPNVDRPQFTAISPCKLKS